MAGSGTLVVDLAFGERLAIGQDVLIELVHKRGQAARLRITAPLDTRIGRPSTAPLRRAEISAGAVPSTPP